MALIIGQAKSQSPCCKKYFPESQSDVFRCCFCPATCPKPKDFSCTVTNNELKQKILTFKKLDPANLGDFFAVIKNHYHYNHYHYQYSCQFVLFQSINCCSSKYRRIYICPHVNVCVGVRKGLHVCTCGPSLFNLGRAWQSTWMTSWLGPPQMRRSRSIMLAKKHSEQAEVIAR